MRHTPCMNLHASPGRAGNVPEPTHAERVRTLLHRERMAALATNSQKHPGFPFASVMPYALRSEGSPLLLISNMAIHTQNLVADPRASLLVMQSGGDGDPLGLARVTLLGSVRRIEEVDDPLREAYLDRHPSAKHWISFSDFGFFRLEVEHVYFVGGFGVMGWVERRDYAAAEPDPLAEAAPRIIEHMNEDHAEALREITRHFSGLEAEKAQMVSCDRLGFTVRLNTAQGMKGTRIAFPEEVRSAGDARRVLVAMTAKARAG